MLLVVCILAISSTDTVPSSYYMFVVVSSKIFSLILIFRKPSTFILLNNSGYQLNTSEILGQKKLHARLENLVTFPNLSAKTTFTHTIYQKL